MATSSHTDEKTGISLPQVPTKAVRNHVERQSDKWRDQKENWVEEIRAHHKRKKTEMAGTHIKNGGLRNTLSGYTVGTEGIQEEGGTTKEILSLSPSGCGSLR